MAWNLDQIPIVCLNLDRRPDRWERVQSQPGFAEFPSIQRWSGTDGKTINLQKDDRISVLTKHNIHKKTRRGHEFINTPGAVGCYLSHSSVYEWLIKQNDTEVVLIFEDDIALPAGCYKMLKDYIKSNSFIQNSQNWDVWMLGPNIMSAAQDSKAGANTIRLLSFVLAHAYFVSKRGALALMQNLYPIELHIDGYMSYKSQIGQLELFGTAQPLFFQNGSTSDIYPGHDCPICDIPDNFNLHSMLISKQQNLIYKIAAGTGTIAVLYLAWRAIVRPSKNQA